MKTRSELIREYFDPNDNLGLSVAELEIVFKDTASMSLLNLRYRFMVLGSTLQYALKQDLSKLKNLFNKHN